MTFCIIWWGIFQCSSTWTKKEYLDNGLILNLNKSLSYTYEMFNLGKNKAKIFRYDSEFRGVWTKYWERIEASPKDAGKVNNRVFGKWL